MQRRTDRHRETKTNKHTALVLTWQFLCLIFTATQLASSSQFMLSRHEKNAKIDTLDALDDAITTILITNFDKNLEKNLANNLDNNLDSNLDNNLETQS